MMMMRRRRITMTTITIMKTRESDCGQCTVHKKTFSTSLSSGPLLPITKPPSNIKFSNLDLLGGMVKCYSSFIINLKVIYNKVNRYQ
jgi:hypothetical protein